MTKLTIFIPLVGYLIIFNENVLHYLELSRELFGISQKEGLVAGGDVTISLRLLLLYFGLCLIAAGSLIYNVSCPRELKKYGSATEYIGSELESMSIIELTALATHLSSQSAVGKKVRQHCARLAERYSLAGDIVQVQRDEEIEADGLLSYFLILNKSHPVARIATAILFASGFTAISFPSLEVFLRVLLVLGHKIILSF